MLQFVITFFFHMSLAYTRLSLRSTFVEVSPSTSANPHHRITFLWFAVYSPFRPASLLLDGHLKPLDLYLAMSACGGWCDEPII